MDGDGVFSFYVTKTTKMTKKPRGGRRALLWMNGETGRAK